MIVPTWDLPYCWIDELLGYPTVWEGPAGSIVIDPKDSFSADFDLTRRPLVIAGRREKLIYSTLYLG